MKYHIKLMTKYDEPNDRGIIFTKEEVEKSINDTFFKNQIDENRRWLSAYFISSLQKDVWGETRIEF